MLQLLSNNNHKIINMILTNLNQKLINIFHKENEFDLIYELNFFDEFFNKIMNIWKSEFFKYNWRMKVKIMEEINL